MTETGGAGGGWTWRLDPVQCVGCGICVDVCDSGALHQDRTMPRPEPVAGRCVGCRDCERQCPTDAITVAATVTGTVP